MKHEQIKLNIDDYIFQCIECLQTYGIFEITHSNFNFCPHCGRNNTLKLTLKGDIECY